MPELMGTISAASNLPTVTPQAFKQQYMTEESGNDSGPRRELDPHGSKSINNPSLLRLYHQIAPVDSNGELSQSTDRFRPGLSYLVETALPDLRDALAELSAVRKDASDEGFPIPSDVAIENATRLLRAMYRIHRQRYEVYATPDGEVAIDAPGGYGRSVIVFCESGGGALCLVNMGDSHRRARYSHAGCLPDGFLRDALNELAGRPELTV